MNEQFSIAGKVAVITGASGVLGGSIARSLLAEGAKVVLTSRNQAKLEQRAMEYRQISQDVLDIACDVLDEKSMRDLAKQVIEQWGKIDILVNVAGGNIAGATIADDKSIFDMPLESWREVVDLNLNGAVYPSIVIGEYIARAGSGSIINVSSMTAYASITRVAGYSAAKSAVSNFTQWMATEMAHKFGDKVRVNAIAPGFFIGDQNRAILLNEDGSLTERSHKVIAKTPMGRFGNIDELNGAVQFLCSDAASFITGVVLPVDGGFLAYSGV